MAEATVSAAPVSVPGRPFHTLMGDQLGPPSPPLPPVMPVAHTGPPPPPPRKQKRRQRRKTRRRRRSRSYSGGSDTASTASSVIEIIPSRYAYPDSEWEAIVEARRHRGRRSRAGSGANSRLPSQSRSVSRAGSFREAMGAAEGKAGDLFDRLLDAMKTLEKRVRQLEGTDENKADGRQGLEPGAATPKEEEKTIERPSETEIETEINTETETTAKVEADTDVEVTAPGGDVEPSKVSDDGAAVAVQDVQVEQDPNGAEGATALAESGPGPGTGNPKKSAERRFDLRVEYFYRGDPQAQRQYESDEIYPFLRVKWDNKKAPAGADTATEAQTQSPGVLQAGAVDVFEMLVESPVLKPYLDKLARLEPLVHSKHETPDHTARFFKPFRWLIQNLDVFRAELADPERAKKHDESIGGESALEAGCEQKDPEHDLHAQLEVLVKTMDEYLAGDIALYQQYRQAKLPRIRFENMWMLFKPDDVLYAPFRLEGQKPRPDRVPRPGHILITKIGRPVPQAYKIVSVTGGRPTIRSRQPQSMAASYTQLEIVVYYVDFDGAQLSSVTDTFVFPPFEGEREISLFEGCPLNYASTLTFNLQAELGRTVEENLNARGAAFLSVCDVSHRLYEGLTIGSNKEELNTAVIIDFELAYQQSESLVPRFSFPTTETLNSSAMPFTSEVHEVVEGSRSNMSVGDWFWSHQIALAERSRDICVNTISAYPAVNKPGTSRDELVEMLRKAGHLLLLPGIVYGFALRNRKWVNLDVRLVQPIQFEAEWNDLVLPSGHKEMVRAVVENHATGSRSAKGGAKSSQEVDIVRGKGKGCIILLHGEPGVGKTSTAECVAAYTKRPLFPITCGDIGYEPSEVEANLDKHFSLAHKWGCVMLLDEADIFLARRSRDDVKRNGLVSVFLRVLEYYPGVLFLTTNRVGAFDDAFRSRIHLSLYYPKLDRRQTIKIWKMNLRRISESNAKRVQDGEPEIRIHTDKILRFVRDHWEQLSWNGRQIRNAFQTAIALSEFDVRDTARPPADEQHRPGKVAASTDAAIPEVSTNKEETAKTLEQPSSASTAPEATVEKGKKPKKKQPTMSTRQFKTIARASMQFDEYLFHTHGRSDEATNARKEQIRWDYELKERRDQGKYKVDLAASSSSTGSSSGSDSESESDYSFSDAVWSRSGADSDSGSRRGNNNDDSDGSGSDSDSDSGKGRGKSKNKNSTKSVSSKRAAAKGKAKDNNHNSSSGKKAKYRGFYCSCSACTALGSHSRHRACIKIYT
ncbi:NTP/NDP exchange transporter [Microdochium nivale]|nr:NTP/NDP exchange transporter [Microdochium nivale]